MLHLGLGRLVLRFCISKNYRGVMLSVGGHGLCQVTLTKNRKNHTETTENNNLTTENPQSQPNDPFAPEMFRNGSIESTRYKMWVTYRCTSRI